MKRIFILLIMLVFLISIGENAYSVDNPSDKVYVLCYHTFKGEQQIYDVSPAELEDQIRSLKALGYNFITYQELVSGKLTGNKNILVTIDDGHISIKNVSETVFKQYDIKPVLFIYPNIIGKKDYVLNYDDLKNYIAQGYTIGAHGFYHQFVNEKLYKKNKRMFMDEIYKSKQTLEKTLNYKVEAFAYPFGEYSDITIEHLGKADYKYAFTIKQRQTILPLQNNMKNFEMPRYMVTKGSWNYILSILKRNNAGSYAQLTVPDNKQSQKGNIKGSKNKLSADAKSSSQKKK